MYKNQIFQDLHDCFLKEDFSSFLNKYIPNFIYKYYSLECNNSELDEMKIKSLINDQIWFSQYNQFNDPNEFKNMKADAASNTGWNEICDWYYNIYKSFMKIASFSDINPEYDLMWQKYGNSGKGYCCKYKVNNNRSFMPAFYLNTNVNPIKTYMSYFQELQHASSNDKRKNIINEKYSIMMKIFASCKDNIWKNEREYRAFVCHMINTKNENINLEYLGIEIDTIYIGDKLPNHLKKRLIKVANDKKCNCLLSLGYYAD